MLELRLYISQKLLSAELKNLYIQLLNVFVGMILRIGKGG
jgi:hypothetical protein